MGKESFMIAMLLKLDLFGQGLDALIIDNRSFMRVAIPVWLTMARSRYNIDRFGLGHTYHPAD